MSAQVAGYELCGTPGWPSAPDDAAYQGMAGGLVGAIAPHTEADRIHARRPRFGTHTIISRGQEECQHSPRSRLWRPSAQERIDTGRDLSR